MSTFLSDLDGLRECLTRRPDVLNFHGFRGEVPVAHYIDDGKLFPTIDRPSALVDGSLRSYADEWNDDFQRGIIPFLPRCPLCGTQNVMTGNSEAGDLKNVSCLDPRTFQTGTLVPVWNRYARSIARQNHKKRASEMPVFLCSSV
jgi:hypothetical protein